LFSPPLKIKFMVEAYWTDFYRCFLWAGHRNGRHSYADFWQTKNTG